MIDIRTFVLVLALGNICFAMLIAGYSRSGVGHPGMQLWKWARLVQGMGHALSYARVDFPSPAMDMVFTTLLVTGIAMEVGAYARFLGVRSYNRVLVPVAIIGVLAMNALRLGGTSPYDMQALLTLEIAVLTAMMSWLLLRNWSEASPLQRMMGLNHVLFCGVMLARAWVWVADPRSHSFGATMVHAMTFLIGYPLMIVNGFGFILLCKLQDDRKMEELATVDGLTGLLNRRAFFERTETARALSIRLQKPVALMMLDIDHFKRLNDRFGHATGDEALIVFAHTVRGVLREQDVMGRLGGEEFALAMPGTDLAGALQAAERLRSKVSGAPVLTDGNAYIMTVSIGVVVIDPNEPINSALARADRALYSAKSNGRNRVESGEAIHPVILSRA